MDFFEAQDDARKGTRRLIFLFVLAVLTLTFVANLLVVAVTAISAHGINAGPAHFVDAYDPWTAAAVTVSILFIIAFSSLYKLGQLAGGGRVVAEMLGGKLIPLNTPDEDRKRLLNVVAEMAIASGTPVPPVYELPGEGSINAFAAGLTPQDAVIGVTRGAIFELDRDRLQGVIAHEFSHILNGDMRLNSRIAGVIYGIMVIGFLGAYLMRFVMYGGARKNRQLALPLLAFGAGLSVIGYGGTFFGGLIQAAVSRQREYLADASAVQFTRNPDGISGALKRIGGLSGGHLVGATAPEFGHAYFTEGVRPVMGFMLSTHPPLPKRIRRIDPDWDGKFDTRPARKRRRTGLGGADLATARSRRKNRLAEEVVTAIVLGAGASVERTGRPIQSDIDSAGSLISRVGEEIRAACEEPYGCRAVIYCLVMNRGNEVLRERQFSFLDTHGDMGIGRLTRGLYPRVKDLDRDLYLPLVDLSMPALSGLSPEQHRLFTTNLTKLIELKKLVDLTGVTLFEWALVRVVSHHLSGVAHDGRIKVSGPTVHIARERAACELLISVLAHSCVEAKTYAQAAFDASLKHLMLPRVALVPEENIGVEQLDQALNRLTRLGPLHKRRLLTACAACIQADGVVTVEQYEVMRAIAAVLGCPMPPGAGQPGR